MLIISKFKDYYDGIFAGQPDKSIVYNRVEENIEQQKVFDPYSRKWNDPQHQYYTEFKRISFTKDNSKGIRRYYRGTSNYTDWTLFLIGFAGKTYLMMRESIHKTLEETKTRFIYDIDEIRGISKEYNRLYYGYGIKNDDAAFENIINKWHDKMHLDLFEHIGAPVFIFTGQELIKNPNLKEINFANKFDPYTASQELYMYIDNHMRPKEDMVEISDEDKAKSRGFHDMSFKNRGKNPKRKKHRK